MSARLGVIEARNWFPRYRVSIVDDSGKTLETRTFFRIKSARSWIMLFEYSAFS